MLPTERNKPQADPTKLRWLIYGPPKIGKSTFASQNKEALFLDTDNKGTEFLDCYRVDIKDWIHLKQVLGEVAASDRFPTIILDTVDRAYQLCREHVCKANGIQHESEDKGFGRVWDMVKTEFNKLISYVQQINRGLWMISHSITKEVKIDGIKRTVTTTSLTDKVGRMVAAIADVIIYIDVGDNGKRKIFVKTEDSLECGDRTKTLVNNIEFDNEQQVFDTIDKLFKEKQI